MQSPERAAKFTAEASADTDRQQHRRGQCCRCGRPSLVRIRRNRADRLLSIVVPVKRYQCLALGCEWQGLLRARPAAGTTGPVAAAQKQIDPGGERQLAQRAASDDSLDRLPDRGVGLDRSARHADQGAVRKADDAASAPLSPSASAPRPAASRVFASFARNWAMARIPMHDHQEA